MFRTHLSSLVRANIATMNPTRFFHHNSSGSMAQLKEVQQLLHHVAYGEQDQAEKKLQKHPELALISGDVTDVAQREFKKMTAFQYAVWALDWHMWTMIKHYLPIEIAKAQFLNLQKNGTPHGLHFDFSDLINTLQDYLDHFDSWSCEQLGIQWCKVIGEAQLKSVAHVGNQLCHPHRSFDPLPDFTDPVLPRNLHLIDGSLFFMRKNSYPEGYLGRHIAVFRWNKEAAGIGTMKPCPNARITAITDLKALNHLKLTRMSQLDHLREEMNFSSGYDDERLPSP